MDETLDREHHMMAAAHHLAKALESTPNLSHDTRRLLSELATHLSSAIRPTETHPARTEIEARLTSAARTITRMHSIHLTIWDAGPTTVSEYLQAVAEVQRLTSTLDEMGLFRTGRTKLLDRAHNTLHAAMARLEVELAHALTQTKLAFLAEQAEYDEESLVSNESDSVGTGSRRLCSSSESEAGLETDLIHPDVIAQIKSIAGLMFGSGYDCEFCRAFVGFWREALAQQVTALGVDPVSIEDVVRMKWEALNLRIRKWRAAIKGIIGTNLVCMKRLFDIVLGDHRPGTVSVCLTEASRGTITCLLNFGHAVSIRPHKPEYLFSLLDMYDELAGLGLYVDALFPDVYGPEPSLRTDFHELLTRLGVSAHAIYNELGGHIESCSSTIPLANGGVHPITKYVMNYILLFENYVNTLERILVDWPGPNITAQMRAVTSALEANLGRKSDLYGDGPLKHIFMTNNILYMVRKVSSSTSVRAHFGPEWEKTHVGKFQHHSKCYERETWGPLLNLLREDGPGLKGRCRAFAAAFEGLYKRQTGWWVPDMELREELRIRASKTVIHAYRNFVGRVGSSIGERHVKYSEHEVGNYILDLLEGSPKSV